MTPRQSYLNAVAPLVKSGLVTRKEALRQDAEWLRVGYDKAGTVKDGKYSPFEVVIPKKAEVQKTLEIKAKTKRKEKRENVDTGPDLFTDTICETQAIEVRPKWVPSLEEIF